MSQVEKRRIREIFAQAQHSATSHEKLCKQARQLYDKMSSQEFLSEFTNCLKVPLIHGDKHTSVENTLNFAAKFSISLVHSKNISPSGGSDDEDEEMCPFVLSIFSLMFEHHNTENQAIRFRVCQFVNKLLNSLGNEACIDDNLCDQISECMMERLQDKAASVRVQALMALHRLQDPTDPNCPVMKAFMFHMSTDPSADVRRAVITNIAITAQSVRSILERTHDIKDIVRRTAYMSLSKLSVQRFTINQRVRLLTDGLKDHSEMVRNCVSKIMLPAWLQYYKGSFLSLLHALDCENSTEISILALKTLFKSEPLRNVLDQLTNILNEEKVIPIEELTPESVLYWRVLHEYIEAHPEIVDERPIDEPLPEIIPELTELCKYIKLFYLERSVDEAEHWVKLQHQYILQHLLEMTKGYDLADEVGRANLSKLCLTLLINERVPEDVVPVLVEIMVRVEPDVEARLQSLAEVISEVREPLAEQEPEPNQGPSIPPEEARQRELKQAAIRVKINELKEEQDEAIREQDFFKAQKLKEEWQALQQELHALAEPIRPQNPEPQSVVKDAAKNRVALCKCLRIVREMVQSDSVKSLSATLRSLMQNFVLPCVQEDNSPIIRNKALEALGLFSLLDEELAKQNFVMFCFQIANDEVCEIALKVTFDLLHLYGLETFQVQEDADGIESDKKKSKKKKKNLFVTDMYEDEFEDEEETQEHSAQTSSGSSANTANLIAMLTSLLDSTSTSMRNLAMEGLYKLLMACRITSSALLSRLILMWYSPVTEGDEGLRQPLGVFLTVYASHCPRSQETLEQAFLPTLRTLMQAPVISPLTQVDQDSVARLFLSLTRPGINKFHAKTTHIHNNMAISICNEILNSEDDSTNVSVLLRALIALTLSFDDHVFCEELKTLCKSVIELFRQSKDKQSLRYLDKFYHTLMNVNNSTMPSTVENTAATNDLEATGSQASTNISLVSTEKSLKRSTKNARLLHPNMHTLLSANEENSDSDDEEESQREPIADPITVPPSPPRSQSFSDDEGGGSADSAPSQDDAVFKVPSQPNKPNRSKKKSQIGEKKEVNQLKIGGQFEKSSSSESDTAPPRLKKRKASSAENAKGLRGKHSSQSSNSKDSESGSDSSPMLVTRHGRRVKRTVGTDSSPSKSGKSKLAEKCSSLSPQKKEGSSQDSLATSSCSTNPSSTVSNRRSRRISFEPSPDQETALRQQSSVSETDSSSPRKSAPSDEVPSHSSASPKRRGKVHHESPKQRVRAKPATESSSPSKLRAKPATSKAVSSPLPKTRERVKPATSESESSPPPKRTSPVTPVTSESESSSPTRKSSRAKRPSFKLDKETNRAKPVSTETESSSTPSKVARPVTSESESSSPTRKSSRAKRPSFKLDKETNRAKPVSTETKSSSPPSKVARPVTSESESSPPPKRTSPVTPVTSESESSSPTRKSSRAKRPSFKLEKQTHRAKPVRTETKSSSTPSKVAKPVTSESESSPPPKQSSRAEPTTSRSDSSPSPKRDKPATSEESAEPSPSDLSPGFNSDSSPGLKSSEDSSPSQQTKAATGNRSPPLRVQAVLNALKPPSKGTPSPGSARVEKRTSASSDSSPGGMTRRSMSGPRRSSRKSGGPTVALPLKRKSPSVLPAKSRAGPASRKHDRRGASSQSSETSGKESDVSPQPVQRSTRRPNETDSEDSSPVQRPPEKALEHVSPSVRFELVIRSLASPSGSTSNGKETNSDSDTTSPGAVQPRSRRRDGESTASGGEQPRRARPARSAKAPADTDSDSSPGRRGKTRSSSMPVSSPDSPLHPAVPKRGRRQGTGSGSAGDSDSSPQPSAQRRRKDAKELLPRVKGKDSGSEESPLRPPKLARKASPPRTSPPRTRRESREANAPRLTRARVSLPSNN